jgi:predicted DNA-binding ribbon-helix-helix protein
MKTNTRIAASATSPIRAASIEPMRPIHPRSNPSLVEKRAVYLPRKTSVSLEDAFWRALREIAVARNLSRHDLVRHIDKKRQQANLSSALRVFVLEYYRKRARRPSNPTARR